jgi:fructose 5-dehydrogenase small subunit
MNSSFRRGRRSFVLTSAALAALALAHPPAMLRAADADFRTHPFMVVSRLVCDATPDLRTAEALYGALSKKVNFDRQLEALAKLANARGMSVEALADQLDSTNQTDLRETLNEIVAAWYLGIVGDRTYAYESALMYRATADVLSPPSYVHAGPLSWATLTPPVEGT